MSALARTQRRARRRGFTLVELLVALVAGLMVALAVVGLSKEATNTFHEETRVASAEMQLRTAIDRLRNDLQRAAYMSTGNIVTDPSLAAPPGQTSSVSTAFASANYKNAGHMSLSTLAGVWIDPSVNAAIPLSSTSVNGVSPQAIELSGNFTSTESFPVGGSAAVAGVSSGVAIEDYTAQANPKNLCANGQRVHIDVNSSPAIWRALGLVGSTATSDAGASDGGVGAGAFPTTFMQLFQPVNGSAGGANAAWPSFIVRFVDPTGKVQFAATCNAGQAAFWNNGNPYVDLAANTPLTTVSQNAGGGGVSGGIGGGTGTINAVQIVRWEIVPSQLADPLGNEGDKYDLVRTWIDAAGNPVGSEVIAEYAVDLKFAFTVDTTTDTTGNGSGKTEVVNPFEPSTSNETIAAFVSNVSAKPQRIRSARMRVVTRAAQPDRTAPLAPTGVGYVYRYCTGFADGGTPTCTPGTQTWARTRTLTSEIALPNQARYWY